MDDRQVHLDIEGSKCFPMMKEQNENDQKEITGAVMDSGKDLIDNKESKGNELLDDAEEGHRQLPGSSACPQGVHQQQQSQPLGALIRWERFLPQRCLRVLLVENDDCTRQVVSALLRNCSYEVVAVANGQQAWRILDDPSNHFDLVLTEVVMPNLSGIGLLSKIMSHNTCKNIPVIMMSSHDSMSTVFKCLSKGAVDFLVKPVRKNELKNLWQHVWRRCHSSSASGSETGSQIQKTVGPPNAAEPENNTGSNDENEGESISLNDRDGSDNGSATQSSWTKRAVEVESPKQKIDGDTSHPCCSTIAQVNQPKLCAIKREWGPLSGSSERQTQKSFDQAMGKDLEIAVHGQKDFEVECRKEEDTEEDAQTESAIGDGENMLDEVAMKAADLIGAIAKQTTSENLQTQDNLNGAKQGNCIQMNNTAFLELSLKRCHQNVKEENKREDGHILRQSGGSAFTRYNTSGVLASHPARESFTATSKQPKGFGPHSFNLTSGSLETEKTGPMPTLARVSSSKGSGGGLSTPMLITNQLSQSSNNQDLGSSVVGPSEQDPTFSIPKPTKEESVPVVSMPYERIYQPSYYSHQGWGSEAQRHKESNNEQKQSKMRTTTQIHHHHHHVQHVHHHHHHHQSSQHKHTHEHHRQSHQHQNHSQCQQDEQTMNNIVPATVASLCGSSNVEGEGNTLDGNNGGPSGSNGNGNGSVSGSNNGSNGQNGSNGSNGQSSAAFTTPKGPNNGESNTAVVKGGGNSGSGSGVDQNRFAQREAVLTKFRQKRKERCFEKKVRYQSRKKLAEQRPRIRGQFVRQSAGDPASTGETD